MGTTLHIQYADALEKLFLLSVTTRSHSQASLDVIASGSRTTDSARCWEVRHANSARQAHAMKWWLLNRAMMTITNGLAYEQYAYTGHSGILK